MVHSVDGLTLAATLYFTHANCDVTNITFTNTDKYYYLFFNGILELAFLASRHASLSSLSYTNAVFTNIKAANLKIYEFGITSFEYLNLSSVDFQISSGNKVTFTHELYRRQHDYKYVFVLTGGYGAKFEFYSSTYALGYTSPHLQLVSAETYADSG